MNQVKEISAEEFVRRLKNQIENQDSKLVFFLGAGCSISSGIPGAKDLVKLWLPRLKKLKTGSENNCDSWVKEEYPEYDEENPSLFYGKIIEELFFVPDERQQEIEILIEGKDPGFGYAVLAQLMTHKDCGRHCNVVLTVNFDDLVADALYLYTNKKPLVISHDSLAGFVKITRTRPLVIKLHGDARLEPKNTEQETKELAENVKNVLEKLLHETGLIFIGYGGNDKSIVEILNELPPNALPQGIYWIGSKIPESEIGKWLKNRNVISVKQNDFDELMLLIWKEFNLSHPKKDRFDELMNTYFETFKNLRKRIVTEPEKEETKPFKISLEKAIKELEKSGFWWTVALEAEKYEKKNPQKADSIYQEGIKKFSNNADLIGYYAIFLKDIRKDYDKAEEYYKMALEIEPKNANNLCNYAIFLEDIRKDHDKAEEYYKKALVINPYHLHTLGNYAVLLTDIRKDHDKAEEYYKKALKIKPDNVWISTNYAAFLLARDDKKGFDLLEKSIELSKRDPSLKPLLLVCLFYLYARSKSAQLQKDSLDKLRVLLKEGIRYPYWNFSDNLKRALEESHPYYEFLDKLSKVISEEVNIRELNNFKVWREDA